MSKNMVRQAVTGARGGGADSCSQVEGHVEGGVAPGVFSEESAVSASTPKPEEGSTTLNDRVPFLTQEWVDLQPKLMQVCMNSLGKYTLSHMEVLYAVDQIMADKFNKLEALKEKQRALEAQASLDSKGAARSNLVGGGHTPKADKGVDNVNNWKGPFLSMIIEMFSNSLVSFRKAEELPFLVKYGNNARTPAPSFVFSPSCAGTTPRRSTRCWTRRRSRSGARRC